MKSKPIKKNIAGPFLKGYSDHLVRSFLDGFPSGTQYQKDECQGMKVSFASTAHRGLKKVILTIPEWTKSGCNLIDLTHSFVLTKRMDGLKKGTILKVQSNGSPEFVSRGNVYNKFNHIRWNEWRFI